MASCNRWHRDAIGAIIAADSIPRRAGRLHGIMPARGERYQIIEKIGEGGMGVVYKARDTELGRLVALKFLNEERSGHEGPSRRFVKEARAASALNHSNIVTIYDITREGDQSCIVMEYVDGQPLSDVIPQDGLPLRQAIFYVTQIGNALAAAHAAGIVHRDLKPSNIVVDPNGDVKVLDFGLAKLMEKPRKPSHQSEMSTAEKPLTAVGALLGTPAYMSPEQALGEDVDSRTDVF